MSGRRNALVGLTLTAGAAVAGMVIKKRQDGRRPHVGLYFEDGSMVSLPDDAPQAATLVSVGREAAEAVRGR